MAINDTLFDLLNKWKTDILTDNSSVGDTKDYVNQMYALLPMLVNQSLVLSDTVLKREDSWDNVNVNTLHYFEDLGVEGSPDSSMIKRQAGYLIYVKSSVSSLGLQVCITEDLHILYRLAPKGTWIMNANDSAITSLSERLASFETQVNQNGLDALNLRVEALRRQVGAVTGDKIKEVSDGLDELSKVISQKVDVYESRQLLTDILNNNDVTIYDDGKQLLAPTIAVEGNNNVIAYNISSNNLPSEVKGYQVETSTDKSKWSINTETVDNGNLLSMINGTKYYVRALALPVDASDRTQSNYSDIVEVTVGTNKTAKTPEKPVPTQYPRTSKTVTPSDVFALASDLKSAVNTINKEKATTGYVDSGLNNLQSKITDTKTAITNALSDVKTQVDNSAVGTNLLLRTSGPFTMGYGTLNTVWNADKKRAEISLPITASPIEILPTTPGLFFDVTPGIFYTQSIYISTDAPLTGTAMHVSWYTETYGHNIKGKDDISSISKNVYRITSTLKWPDGRTDNNIRVFDLYNLGTVFDFNKGTFLYFYQPKIELGSHATDWCPNPSEIATNDEIMKKADKTELANYLKPWTGTQEEYDAISPHDPNTLYMIVAPITTTHHIVTGKQIGRAHV